MKSLLKMTLLSSAIILVLAGCDDKKDNLTATQPSSDQTQIESASISNNGDQTQIKAETVTNDGNKTEVNKEVITETIANGNNDTIQMEDVSKETYAFGASIANSLNDSFTVNNLTVDKNMIINGFNDALQGKAKYTQEEIDSLAADFQQRAQKEIIAHNEAIIASNTEAGDKFRADFAKEKGVVQTESGLLYQIIDAGSAKHPTKDDVVTVQYTGTLIDNQKFDSSYDRNEPAMFVLGQVIPGWAEGIQKIGVGGKIKLVIPPNLAYGDQSFPAQPGYAAITPASTLVFEVELSDIYDDSKVPQTYDEGNTK